MDNPEKLAILSTQVTRRRQAKQQTKHIYVLDTTIHNAQDEDNQTKQHNTICAGHHYYVYATNHK